MLKELGGSKLMEGVWGTEMGTARPGPAPA